MTAKILVSQPKPQTEKSPYYEVAKKYDVDLVFRPFIKVEPMSAKDFRQQKVSIPGHTAVVFTSRHAIDHFFALCKACGNIELFQKAFRGHTNDLFLKMPESIFHKPTLCPNKAY